MVLEEFLLRFGGNEPITLLVVGFFVFVVVVVIPDVGGYGL